MFVVFHSACVFDDAELLPAGDVNEAIAPVQGIVSMLPEARWLPCVVVAHVHAPNVDACSHWNIIQVLL